MSSDRLIHCYYVSYLGVTPPECSRRRHVCRGRQCERAVANLSAYDSRFCRI